ncbi:MAG: hypothetical protein WCO88_14910 [Actinomycetota bacterium]
MAPRRHPRSFTRLACAGVVTALLAATSGCSLAMGAARGAAEAAECSALDLTNKGLAKTDHLSGPSIGVLAGTARLVANTVKSLHIDELPSDANARLDDAANQLDLASQAFPSDPKGAQEVVTRAVGQIESVVTDVREKLSC